MLRCTKKYINIYRQLKILFSRKEDDSERISALSVAYLYGKPILEGHLTVVCDCSYMYDYDYDYDYKSIK